MAPTRTKHTIWFWERIVSPHNGWFLAVLARQGTEVFYVTEQVISDDRVQQGWAPPLMVGVHSVLVTSQTDVDQLVARASADSIHICDGIRSNRLVGHAQRALARRGLRQWVVMETVDDAGWRGLLKRLEYRRLFWVWKDRLEGVLATGSATGRWLNQRGVPANRVFPFAYFLKNHEHKQDAGCDRSERFRFLFVGQFIERKRLDLLITALGRLGRADFELAVVGSGPLEEQLHEQAENTLPGNVSWIGKLPIDAVPDEMARADCLILPSRHDGWGAVVSEALMVGTPVICSDRCGTAGVVRVSGYGGVFHSDCLDELVAELVGILSRGRLSDNDRAALARWAECLGAEAGAEYLQEIFDHVEGAGVRPAPPWGTGKNVL